MTQAAIRQLIADVVNLPISMYVEEDRVTFATGTLTNDALSWWNAYAQPIGIEQANRITWTELKRLLTNKYCPRTEVKKMEDEFYNLAVKGNDLKTYVRRFQELAVLCPNMVPNTEKLMEVFIGGLPRSIEGNVTASKPQTLEEAITITQRLMEQVIKHNSAQETNDHKRKFEDRRNTTDNNNYPNDRNNNNHSNNHNNDNYQNNHNNHNRNNDYHQQQNRRQETIRTYAATPTENKRSLHCQVSDLQQSGSSDQGLQKLRTSISKPSLHHSTKSRDEISVIEQPMAWSGTDLKMAKLSLRMAGLGGGWGAVVVGGGEDVVEARGCEEWVEWGWDVGDGWYGAPRPTARGVGSGEGGGGGGAEGLGWAAAGGVVFGSGRWVSVFGRCLVVDVGGVCFGKRVFATGCIVGGCVEDVSCMGIVVIGVGSDGWRTAGGLEGWGVLVMVRVGGGDGWGCSWELGVRWGMSSICCGGGSLVCMVGVRGGVNGGLVWVGRVWVDIVRMGGVLVWGKGYGGWGGVLGDMRGGRVEIGCLIGSAGVGGVGGGSGGEKYRERRKQVVVEDSWLGDRLASYGAVGFGSFGGGSRGVSGGKGGGEESSYAQLRGRYEWLAKGGGEAGRFSMACVVSCSWLVLGRVKAHFARFWRSDGLRGGVFVGSGGVRVDSIRGIVVGVGKEEVGGGGGRSAECGAGRGRRRRGKG
ncbi:reverse transcriptase domain-containing protein [Tanacetum coccineum]